MKRRFLALAAALLLAACLLAGCGNGFSVQDARKGTARVLAFYDRTFYLYDGQNMEVYTKIESAAWSSGSAFGVGESGKETKYFVTNRHVVEDVGLSVPRDENGDYIFTDDGRILCYEDKRQNLVYLLLDDYAYSNNTLDPSRSVPCNVIYQADEGNADLAVLEAAEPVKGRMALPLVKDSKTVESGDEVIALGYPASTDRATINTSGETETFAGSVDKVTVTRGNVSLHNVFVDDNDARIRTIQHTATINHGNSGGPLITNKGAVAGVNTWGTGQNLATGDQQNYHSIEIEYVADVLEDLKIDFDYYQAGPSMVMIAAAAAVVVVVAVGAVLVTRRKPVPVPEPEPAPVPEPAPMPQPAPPQPGSFRIQGQSGAFTGRRFAITGQTPGQVRIGTDPGKNDLVYPSTPGISRVHCVLIEQGGVLYLRDLGSTYGTFLAGGQRLAANQPVQLKIGDRFYLGSEKEMFQITGRGGI